MLPATGDEGRKNFDAKDVAVVERNLGADFVYFVDANEPAGFIHPYLLLDSLLEYVSAAYKRLVERLGKVP